MNDRLYINADALYQLEVDEVKRVLRKTFIESQKPLFMLTQYTDSQMNDAIGCFCHENNANRIKKAFALHYDGETLEAMGQFILMMEQAIDYAANESMEKST